MTVYISGTTGIDTVQSTANIYSTGRAFTAPQRNTAIANTTLSMDLTTNNNFNCTPSAPGALTFTNIASASGQGGYIKFVNGSNYNITAGSNTKILPSDLGKISTTGTYLMAYYSDGTYVYVTASGNLA